MGKTKIEWATDVWNPLAGCSLVSPGCTNCYAMKMAARIERMSRGQQASYRDEVSTYAPPGESTISPHGTHYVGTTKIVNGKPVWTGKVALAPEHILTAPLRWRRPRMVFVNSMSDLFHESIPDAWIDRVFAVMALAPQHTFQILTKRSARMRDYFTGRRTEFGRAARALMELPHSKTEAEHEGAADALDLSDLADGRPLPNVWLGVSAEDQPRADERIPDLLATPAAVRFVSAEPLLSALDLSKWLHDGRREGLSGSGRLRAVQSRGRQDLAPGEVDGRWRGVQPDLHAANPRGDERRASGKLSSGTVQGWGCAQKSERASDHMDGSEPETNSARHGSEPSGRQQAEQRSRELGNRDASAERATLAHAPCAEEEGSTRREELIRSGDREASDRNPRDLGVKGHVATRHSEPIRDHAIDGLGDRGSEKLGSPSLSWIIAGSESGPGARPMSLDWVRSIRDQCAAAKVAFFFKQTATPSGRKVPRPLLDGVEHSAFPETQ